MSGSANSAMPDSAGAHHFTAKILSAPSGGAYVQVPLDVEATFGKKRLAVRATFDGVEYRGSVVRMGTGDHVLGITKAVQSEIGKGPGDEVNVTLEEDLAERVVVVPDDLAQALSAAPGTADFLGSLSYTRQREYVLWIESAKRDATRQERIARTVTLLKERKPLRG